MGELLVTLPCREVLLQSPHGRARQIYKDRESDQDQAAAKEEKERKKSDQERPPASSPRRSGSLPESSIPAAEPQPACKMPRSCGSRSGALLLALLLQASVEVRGWCLETSQCQDLTTESNLLACIRACKIDLSAETPVFPGNGEEQPLTENPRKYVMGHFRWDRFGRRNSSSGGGASQKREEEEVVVLGGPGPRGDGGDGGEAGPREGKRSYSMEHFRWGKPVGKKRRPVKVYPNGAEDESAEAFPLEFKRELAGERPEGAAARAELGYSLVAEAEAAEKKDEGPYKMEHFRWGSPRKDKRYGGFMSSEKSQTPLVTLFKNAIIKNAHKKGQ
ncbi:pro-opiomelanocortin isoform X2 [Equus przewalskii]|uniref:Pro-opiomelanocortin n=1 Tax=Equus przewalskii TaxID=9798 RepID=A0ABM2EHU1_EQUPR